MTLLLLLYACNAGSSDADTDRAEDTSDARDSAPDPGSVCPAVEAPRSTMAGTCLAFDGPLEMTKVWARPMGGWGAFMRGASIGPLWDSNGDFRITAADQPYVVWGSVHGSVGVAALSGRDGSAFWNNDASSAYLANLAPPVLINLTGNTGVEVVGYTGSLKPDPDMIRIFEGTEGERIAQGSPLGDEAGMLDSVAVADVTGDGVAEILHGRSIIGTDGNLLASGLYGSGRKPDEETGAISRASYGVDLDGDGVAEVLAGPSAYHGDGTVLWSNASLPDGQSIVADFDGDLEPEVLFVSGQWMWGLSAADGEVEWGPIALEGTCSDTYGAGPAAVEDLDADGLPEFVIPCAGQLAAYTWGGDVLWSISEGRTEIWGVSIADLDGDGVPEVAYAATYSIAIAAGPNGAVRWRAEDRVVTGLSPPIFADLDLDGTIEMVTTSFVADVEGDEITAWRANPAGPGRRTIWNSHSYHISDITDDMKVPAVSAPYWLTTNSFRSAGLGERAPDIALSPQFVEMCELECAWGRVVFTATLANAGSEASPPGLEVVLTAGPGGAVLATATTTEEVPPYSTGEALRFEIRLEDLKGQPPTLEVDPGATRLQCLTWPEDDLVSWPGGVCG